MGDFPTKVEQYWHNGQSDKGRTCGHTHVRCFGLVGLWSLHSRRGVVPVEVAPSMERGTHHSEGAPPNRSGDGNLVVSVDRPGSAMSM